MLAVLAATTLFARVGEPGFARLFYTAAALVAATFFIRRSPWHYVTLTFWFWTLTPLARRLIDYNAAFDPADLVLATPNLMTLFMVRDIVTSRDILRQRASLIGLCLLLPVCYGLAVSFLQGEIMPGATAAADWAAPLLYYFYFIANWRRISEAEAPFRDLLSVNGLFMVGYGIPQYFDPQPWDVAWVLDSGLASIGRPLPYELRIFGTLNAPVLLATWLGAGLLLSLHFRTKITTLLAPACVILLLMTLVRAVAGTVLLGFLLAGLLGGAKTVKALGVALMLTILAGAAASVIDPAMTGRLAARFNTLGDLGTDYSALARAKIYQAAPAVIDANPLGLGIGSLGRGALVMQNTDLVVVDAGPIEIYLALGWIAGSVYLVGIALVVVQALIAAWTTRSAAALALAVAATAGIANLPFENITGFFAATVWTCAAYATALGISARMRCSAA